jgi:hypothetical protein
MKLLITIRAINFAQITIVKIIFPCILILIETKWTYNHSIGCDFSIVFQLSYMICVYHVRDCSQIRNDTKVPMAPVIAAPQGPPNSVPKIEQAATPAATHEAMYSVPVPDASACAHEPALNRLSSIGLILWLTAATAPFQTWHDATLADSQAAYSTGSRPRHILPGFPNVGHG